MKTPKEIESDYAKVTDEQVTNVVKALDAATPDKQLWALLGDCRKDGLENHQQLRVILGSAYDWFRFGN